MGQRLTVRMTVFSPPDPISARGVLVRVGEVVRCGQPLFELDTDKATVELPSPADGVVVEVLVAVGQPFEYDSPLLVLEVASDAEPGAAADGGGTSAFLGS